MAGTVTTTVNEPMDSTTPDLNFRWDSPAQQSIFNISAKGYAANVTYFFRISLNNGTNTLFSFGLKSVSAPVARSPPSAPPEKIETPAKEITMKRTMAILGLMLARTLLAGWRGNVAAQESCHETGEVIPAEGRFVIPDDLHLVDFSMR